MRWERKMDVLGWFGLDPKQDKELGLIKVMVELCKQGERYIEWSYNLDLRGWEDLIKNK